MLNVVPLWLRDRVNGAARRANGQPLEVFKQFDDALGSFFKGLSHSYAGNWGFSARETENEFVFTLDAPGFEVNEFDIQVAEDVVTVTAEHLVGEGDQKHAERSFNRQFPLPELADAAKVEARYRNGVLELRFAKVEQAKPRKIEVRAE